MKQSVLFILSLSSVLMASSTRSARAEEPSAKLNFGGLVQARHATAEDEGFSIRRGELKGTYALDEGEVAIKIDATPEGVRLRDAEATYVEPFTGLHLRLTAGQFVLPFGGEVQESSGTMLRMERSTMTRTLFPGERDLGLKLGGTVDGFRFGIAAVNGQGLGDPLYVNRDADGKPALLGRFGYESAAVKAGVSGYLGRAHVPVTEDSDVVESRRRTRAGADLKLTLKMLGIGSTGLGAEGMVGHEAGDAFRGFAIIVSQDAGPVTGFVGHDEYRAGQRLEVLVTDEIGANLRLSDLVRVRSSYHWLPMHENSFVTELQAKF